MLNTVPECVADLQELNGIEVFLELDYPLVSSFNFSGLKKIKCNMGKNGVDQPHPTKPWFLQSTIKLCVMK